MSRDQERANSLCPDPRRGAGDCKAAEAVHCAATLSDERFLIENGPRSRQVDLGATGFEAMAT